MPRPRGGDPRPFDTVYFGGGTPSLLPAEDLARVVAACREHLKVALEAWVFLEANPEDVTPEACAAWRGLGVRTLSLGTQAFSDDALRFLGRRHGADQARAAVETTLAAGFPTVSVDLIFGLPGQSPEAWRHELATAAALAPGHVSCYQLTIHERTRFGIAAKRGRLSAMPEGEQAALFEITHRVLADAGYSAYEVSNFARGRDHESRHNRKYWDHTPYLGLGPSAHSFAPPGAGAPYGRRWWNELRTPRWEGRVAAGERPVEAEESLGPKALATEAVMLGLRTTAGIDLDGALSSSGESSVRLIARFRSCAASRFRNWTGRRTGPRSCSHAEVCPGRAWVWFERMAAATRSSPMPLFNSGGVAFLDPSQTSPGEPIERIAIKEFEGSQAGRVPGSGPVPPGQPADPLQRARGARPSRHCHGPTQGDPAAGNAAHRGWVDDLQHHRRRPLDRLPRSAPRRRHLAGGLGGASGSEP